jgi:hypothetical protein
LLKGPKEYYSWSIFLLANKEGLFYFVNKKEKYFVLLCYYNTKNPHVISLPSALPNGNQRRWWMFVPTELF